MDFFIARFFYYERIIGLSAALAGIATAIAIFADAITDPAVGAILIDSDHAGGDGIRSCSCSDPLGVLYFLLFNPPEDLLGSQTLLLAGLLCLRY